jgi:hypothetical protein
VRAFGTPDSKKERQMNKDAIMKREDDEYIACNSMRSYNAGETNLAFKDAVDKENSQERAGHD